MSKVYLIPDNDGVFNLGEELTPEAMIQWDDNQLLKAREAFNHKIEEMQATCATISSELLFRLGQENLNGKVVGDYAISKVRRLTFKTKIEEARLLGAVKEEVDTKILKELYNKGVQIPDVQETEYLLVRAVQTEAESENA